MKKDEIEYFSLLVFKRKQARGIENMESRERDRDTHHDWTGLICPRDGSDLKSWLVIIVFLVLSFLSVKSCRHGDKVGNDKESVDDDKEHQISLSSSLSIFIWSLNSITIKYFLNIVISNRSRHKQSNCIIEVSELVKILKK